MLCLYVILLSYTELYSASESTLNLCEHLNCDDQLNKTVCGARRGEEGLHLRLFKNECELLKYGCRVQRDKAYGIIDIDYCKNSFNRTDEKKNNAAVSNKNEDNMCVKNDCLEINDTNSVCGITSNGSGYSIRLFINRCHLTRYNCIHKTKFSATDLHICKNMENSDDSKANLNIVNKKIPNMIIVDANMFNFNNNINDTIDNFFAATHAIDIPVDELSNHLNDSGRRRLVNVFGPVEIFKPRVKKPKEVKEDHLHMPTLSSCYHKCPTKCPDTYAPVCGMPGLVAREPVLMFQNHCYMDVAQCKMKWENKSPTAISSYYIEASFFFCLGDTVSNVYRFLPLIRTLQHMGRLKKKGKYRYRFSNMRFFNNILKSDIKLMGR